MIWLHKKLTGKFDDKNCSVWNGRTLSILDETNDHALDDESFETIPQVKIPPKENEVDFVKEWAANSPKYLFTFANLS